MRRDHVKCRMPLLEELASRRLILCPKSRQPLSISADGRFAEAGGRRWSVKNGALDLYGDYRGAPAVANVPKEFTRAVVKALKYPQTPEMLAAVEAAIADTALTAGDTAYTAEIRELSDRLGIAASEDAPAAPLAGELNRDPRIAFERTFIEPVLPAGRHVRRSVRIRNDGLTTIASTGARPVVLSYHWLDAVGNIVAWDGARTKLPVPIAPGGSLTVICEIEVPVAPGWYRLQFQPLVEGERWIAGELLTVPVTVDVTVPAVLTPAQTGKNHDYGQDHAVGLGLVAQYVVSHAIARRRLLLEVGGAIHPQAASLVAHGCDVVAIDISFPMSQLGQLYFDHVETEKKGHIAFLACDAHDPPFPEATFDGVTIFAALHHFADPLRLLANLRRVVKPGGFIAVMCEPCMPDPTAAMYLRDLEKGINEQCWTVEEHGEIFLASGLRPIQAQVDVASLKVILAV